MCAEKSESRFHLSWRRAAVAIVALLVGPNAEGQVEAGPGVETAEATLASRGLKRIGNLFLLEAEIAAREQIAQDEAAANQLRAEAAAVQAAGQQAVGRRAEMDRHLNRLAFERSNLIFYANRLAGTDDPNVAAQLAVVQIQIRELQDAVDRIGTSRALIETEQRQRSQRLAELQGAITQREADARRRLVELAASYNALAADREVGRALKELNRSARPWVMIGPEADSEKNLGRFAQAVLAEAGLRRDRQGRVTLAAEAEVRELGHRAWLIEQKLGGPQDDRLRGELAEIVDRLRAGIDEVGRSYDALARDPLIAGALDHVAGGSRRRALLGPSPEFAKEVARLPAFEQLLEED